MCRLCLTILLLIGATALWAQDVRVVRFEKFQIADTEVGISDATRNPPGYEQLVECEGRLETAQARYRFDGGTLGSTTGILLDIGDVLPINGPAAAAALRFVKTGSTTAVFQVSCWR